MKKLLVILTATLVCVGAFGQGKLAFQVDTTQLIYMTTENTLLKHLNPLDAGKTAAGFPLAGSSLYTGAGSTVASLAGTPSFTAALYAGATAGSLSQVATATLASASLAGQLNQLNVTLANLLAGTPAFFQIQVFDSSFASAAAAWAVEGKYAGETGVFQATPQASVYSPIYFTSPSPVASTLPVGTFVPLDYAAYPGYKGLIEVYATTVPEPGTFALAGLGLASLMIFRRRK
jgi:hypothetical protein